MNDRAATDGPAVRLYLSVERVAHFDGELLGIERFRQEKHAGIKSIAGMK